MSDTKKPEITRLAVLQSTLDGWLDFVVSEVARKRNPGPGVFLPPTPLEYAELLLHYVGRVASHLPLEEQEAFKSSIAQQLQKGNDAEVDNVQPDNVFDLNPLTLVQISMLEDMVDAYEQGAIRFSLGRDNTHWFCAIQAPCGFMAKGTSLILDGPPNAVTDALEKFEDHMDVAEIEHRHGRVYDA